jgi:hypothetical protein
VETEDLKVEYRNTCCAGRGRGDVVEDDVTEKGTHGEGSEKIKGNG